MECQNISSRRCRTRARWPFAVLLLLLLDVVLPSDAVSIRRFRRTKSDEEEEGSAIPFLTSRKQPRASTVRAIQQKFDIQLPSTLPSLSERARTLQNSRSDNELEGGLLPSSFIEFVEIEEKNDFPQKVQAAAKPQLLPTHFLNGGIVLLALSSFVFTNHSAGFKPLRELLSGSVSALALVWLPTLVLRGGWLECFGLVSLLTQPPVRSFVQKELIPRALATVKKIFWTEIWRRTWTIVLAPLPKPLFVPSNEDLLARIVWLPEWTRNGFQLFQSKVDTFVLSTMKASIQKSFFETMGIFYDSMTNSMLEISIIYSESTSSETPTAEWKNSDDDTPAPIELPVEEEKTSESSSTNILVETEDESSGDESDESE